MSWLMNQIESRRAGAYIRMCILRMLGCRMVSATCPDSLAMLTRQLELRMPRGCPAPLPWMIARLIANCIFSGAFLVSQDVSADESSISSSVTGTSTPRRLSRMVCWVRLGLLCVPTSASPSHVAWMPPVVCHGVVSSIGMVTLLLSVVIRSAIDSIESSDSMIWLMLLRKSGAMAKPPSLPTLVWPVVPAPGAARCSSLMSSLPPGDAACRMALACSPRLRQPQRALSRIDACWTWTRVRASVAPSGISSVPSSTVILGPVGSVLRPLDVLR